MAITYDILIGMHEDARQAAFKNGLLTILQKNAAFNVGKMDIMSNIEDIQTAVGSGAYDILICKETVNNQNIGAGKVAELQKLNPKVRILLILNNEKYGGDKVLKLYETGYYNALFFRDFAIPEKFVSALTTDRTQKDAFEYYGIMKNAKYFQKTSTQNPSDLQEQRRMVADSPAMVTSQSTIMPQASASVKENVIPEPMSTLQKPEFAESNISTHMPDKTFNVFDMKPPVQKKNPNSYEHAVAPDMLKTSLMEDVASLMGDESDINAESVFPEKKEAYVKKPVEAMKHDYGRTSQETSVKEDMINKNYEREIKENKNGKETKENTGVKEVGLRSENTNMKKKDESNTQVVLTRVNRASVVPHEAYIVSAISDTALIVEVPDAHFLDLKDALPSLPVNLITPQILGV